MLTILQRIAPRLKVGDRVWVPSDSWIARQAGYFPAKNSRLYGSVVDTDFQGDTERYAIKWDAGVLSGEVTWVNSRKGLNPVNTPEQ